MKAAQLADLEAVYLIEDRDGAGEWSTFVVSVGTPAQVSRVIVSTAGYETWVVLGPGCPASYGSNCAFNRGGIFSVDNSSSWANISLFELDLERNLGYTGNGQFGYDTVTLGYPHSGGPSLSKQIVAGLAAPDFWLGHLGLDPSPSNFTTLNDPQTSYLWTLKNQSMIPSTSWGYTAGAAYLQGSLTLGGYDSSRFDSKNVTFPFYNDVSRRFIADLRSITYMPTGVSTVTSSTTLVSQSISMYIDSTIPYIYLPLDACAKFESAFGLVWNATDEIYTLNETAHATLTSTNPMITFMIANTAGETLDIVLPYAAFDLTASFPSVLQEAYLIADYDRSEFTVAPCAWPSTFTENIVAIHPPDFNDTITIIHKPKITPIGAIVGGVVGGIAFLLALALAYWFVYNPKHAKKRAELVASSDPDFHVVATADHYHDKMELSTGVESVLSELPAYDKAQKQQRMSEIAGTSLIGHELESRPIYEMPTTEPVGSELHTTHHQR
ncbi:aspartic peptidase domain-containing protein [Rhexocercosporidium sp. MPI-PUGE-AT-0058]|nr:aspartic peptidase domain-containing protein [Rhexocercosporidium sp. MPI-PUGE-AT-0058]